MITDPLVPLISRLRLTPDIMTTIGLVINLVAAVIIAAICSFILLVIIVTEFVHRQDIQIRY